MSCTFKIVLNYDDCYEQSYRYIDMTVKEMFQYFTVKHETDHWCLKCITCLRNAYWDGYIVNDTNITSFLVFNWTSVGCCALLYYDITKFNMLAGYFLFGIHEWDQHVFFYFCVIFGRGCCFREYTFKMFLLLYLGIALFLRMALFIMQRYATGTYWFDFIVVHAMKWSEVAQLVRLFATP